jgi:PAS domain S-box-containing protein
MRTFTVHTELEGGAPLEVLLKEGQTVKMNQKGRQTAGPEKGAGEALSAERYRIFIESIHDGVYEVDVHGNFTYLNNSLCRIFGYPREEIHRQNFSKFMDEDRAKAAFTMFNKIFRTGEGISDIIWEIRDKDGNTRIIELSANLITDRDGRKTGFRGIARDVTDKFRAQEDLKRSEKRYRTLLDFVPYPTVVFTANGDVSYLNPAFTETFGWTFEELAGKRIPYVPPGLEKETQDNIQRLFKEKALFRVETRRLTKDGRLRNVIMRAAFVGERGDETAGVLVILRDITNEKRLARNNEAMLRISMALPEYPELEELLDYVSDEVKRLLGCEGALVILHDEERNELFFLGAAYDDTATRTRVKEIRFPIEGLVAGTVIRTGEPLIVHDTSKERHLHIERDRKLGYHTRNLALVPLRSSDRIIGVLCAINKKEGSFEESDLDLLNMIAGTVVLSIENARFADEIKKAYREVTKLNRAKDRVINHLAHELKTPCAVLLASLKTLSRKLALLPDQEWKRTMDRVQRNLDRLLEIQDEVDDIIQDRHYAVYPLMSFVLEQCADELEALAAEDVGGEMAAARIRKRVEELFGPRERALKAIFLHEFVARRLEANKGSWARRGVKIESALESCPAICMPEEPLAKIVDGLVRNAIENTPDEGCLEVMVSQNRDGIELKVRDYGIGITSENQRRIFEGFFTTQPTDAYSSKRRFDFKAGGKGADLLRMKIFSERYRFKIDMTSTRCHHIPTENDACPGRISECGSCTGVEDCKRSGGTTFTLLFPPAPDQGC